jgi:hypothetical protein
MKQWIECQKIIYYKKYVDILIIFDQNKVSKTAIINYVNNVDEHLEFKASEEINNSINYLDNP